MAKHVIGYDIGGTNSRALVADSAGVVVGFGRAGAGSYEVVGWDGLATALHSVTDAALSSCGVRRDQIAGAGFGIAGYDWPGERQPHLDAIASLGLQAPFELVNDSMIGLIAGASTGWGIAVVAGTGANCWGRDRHGKLGHATGGAAMLGEYGGADTLVPEALCAVSRAFTKRGPETALCGALAGYAGAADVADLLEGVFVGRYTIDTDAAPLIFEAARAGDAVAQGLVRWAGRELGSLAIGVVRQLHLEQESFDAVQIGSLFGASEVLGTTMLATLQEVAPGATAISLTVPPVIGAVLLAMEAVGVNPAAKRSALLAADLQGLTT